MKQFRVYPSKKRQSDKSPTHYGWYTEGEGDQRRRLVAWVSDDASINVLLTDDPWEERAKESGNAPF